MPRVNVYMRSFTLGKYYLSSKGELVKFIKVTPKGFNLLNVRTNKCLFMSKHLYSKKYWNKPIPRDIHEVKQVWVPDWAYFTAVEVTDTPDGLVPVKPSRK